MLVQEPYRTYLAWDPAAKTLVTIAAVINIANLLAIWTPRLLSYRRKPATKSEVRFIENLMQTQEWKRAVDNQVKEALKGSIGNNFISKANNYTCGRRVLGKFTVPNQNVKQNGPNILQRLLQSSNEWFQYLSPRWLKFPEWFPKWFNNESTTTTEDIYSVPPEELYRREAPNTKAHVEEALRQSRLSVASDKKLPEELFTDGWSGMHAAAKERAGAHKIVPERKVWEETLKINREETVKRGDVLRKMEEAKTKEKEEFAKGKGKAVQVNSGSEGQKTPKSEGEDGLKSPGPFSPQYKAW